MYVFNALNHLVGKHENSLQGELALAVIKEILQAGTKQIHDHYRIITFNTEPMDLRNTDSIMKDLIQFRFIQQLRMLSLDWFQFYCTLLIVLYIDSFMNR